MQNKLVIDVEVISSAVTDQFHLHSITAGEGHTGNVAGNAAAPVITAAGGLIYNADLVRSHGRGHVHEELDHLTAAVDQQAELGISVVIQHLFHIEGCLKHELVGKYVVQISILRCAGGTLDGRIGTVVLAQVKTVGRPVIALTDTEGITKAVCLGFCIGLGLCRTLVDSQRQILYRGGCVIAAGEFDGALCHGDPAAGIVNLVINQEIHLIAIYDHFKIDAVAIAVQLCAFNQPPIRPTFLVCLGHGEDLITVFTDLFQSNEVLVLGIGRDQDA